MGLDDVALKETEQEHKEGKRDSTTELNRNLKKELKLTQEELDAALKYYDELKPDCLDMGLSYADRKAQREEDPLVHGVFMSAWCLLMHMSVTHHTRTQTKTNKHIRRSSL